VLSQQDPDTDLWHPIGFYSKRLTPAELNYHVHDKELLAILRALKRWRHYFLGSTSPFTIMTDHKNLTYFSTKVQKSERQLRWSQYIQEFNFNATQIQSNFQLPLLEI
jgi:hypothetical protein